MVIKLASLPQSTPGPSTSERSPRVTSHLTWLPLLENNHIFWPFRKHKKSYSSVSINPFLHVAMAQLVSSRFSVSCGDRAARVWSCSDFIVLLTAGNLLCSGPTPDGAWEPQAYQPIRSREGEPGASGGSGRRGQQSQACRHPPAHQPQTAGLCTGSAPEKEVRAPSTEGAVLSLWNRVPLTVG